MKLYVLECRLAKTGKWRTYGAYPVPAYQHRKEALLHLASAKEFNRREKMTWDFRVSTFHDTCCLQAGLERKRKS